LLYQAPNQATSQTYQPVITTPSPERQLKIDVGARIKALRIDKGLLKQKDLAEKAGIRQAYLSNIENGWKLPSETEATQIAAALGVQPKDFIEPPETTTVPATDDSAQNTDTL
jgi:transcriptional regulator with XRE-family HTH domain